MLLFPTMSLRVRLLILILVPLTVISVFAGYWRISEATETTREVFDRTLVALTLAISRDVIVSEGDAISETTYQMLRDAVEGHVFYHVYGPDGSFITGYATPPVMPPGVELKGNEPFLFDSVYRGDQVRAARLQEYATFDTVSGFASVTVWQPMAERETFVRQQALRALALIASLYLTVAAVVWFGINLGLKPLTELQDAISQRSSDDLSKIKRPVPPEVLGVVGTLNALFQQVQTAMKSRDRFISDAAHQLRNPVAGLLSLAEAARDAKSPEDRVSRVDEIVQAARHASYLTNQLLSLERAKGQTDQTRFERKDLNEVVRAVCERNAPKVLGKGLDFGFHAHEKPLDVRVDELLVQEAVQNLIDNALIHTGSDNTEINVAVALRDGMAYLCVSDKGAGLDVKDSEVAFSRFGQLSPSQGSGLGLAIVEEIAAVHGGRAEIESSDEGARISLSFPMD